MYPGVGVGIWESVYKLLSSYVVGLGLGLGLREWVRRGYGITLRHRYFTDLPPSDTSGGERILGSVGLWAFSSSPFLKSACHRLHGKNDALKYVVFRAR